MSESTDSPSVTSPMETTTEDKKKHNEKKNSNKETKEKIKKPKTDEGSGDDFDDSGEIDEELDKIEDEDEDVSEDGILLGDDDVNSSELYRMQNRLFGSATPSDTHLENEDENEHTEEVQRAMNDINRDKQMFSSEEDKEILGMKSPSRITSKKHKPNKKYGQLE